MSAFYLLNRYNSERRNSADSGKAGTYRHNTSEASWIYTIARNLTYDILRRQKRESLEDTDFLLQLPSAEGNPEAGPYARALEKLRREMNL